MRIITANAPDIRKTEDDKDRRIRFSFFLLAKVVLALMMIKE